MAGPSRRQSRHREVVVDADAVSCPADVTPALLTSLLRAHYAAADDDDAEASAEARPEVATLAWRPLGRGVLSDVQVLDVGYRPSHGPPKGGNSGAGLPNRFLAKFRKEEIPLRNLFEVEGQFYRLAGELSSLSWGEDDTGPFPFRLVDAVASGPDWILLEYIPPERMDLLDVHEGCPPERFDDLLARLAGMHATCWMSDASDGEWVDSTSLPAMVGRYAGKLSSTPGAGHTLPTSMRQQQFAPGWPGVRERMLPYFHSDEGARSLQQLEEIISWTSQSSRIERIAQSVAGRKCTLVHGDFHIGNMLLPNEADVGQGTHPVPWLVDWSMAGVGDPCLDLVFFLIVGAAAIPTHKLSSDATEITSERLGLILKQYYQALTSGAKRQHVSWEAFLSMFGQCLLNQLVILVCYDGLCRNMADASPDRKTYHDHFDRVNVRCARMLLTEYGMPRLWNEREDSGEA